jgi:UDP-N-acetyl-D-glucosamine dehydrogenase
MELLEDQGASLCYHDPYVARLKKVRKHDFSHMASVDLSTEILADQDAVLITTDHTNVDYQKLVAGASLVIDTRNATKGVLTGREKIVRA